MIKNKSFSYKCLSAFFILIIWTSFTFAITPTQSLNEANLLYTNNNFTDALSTYESLLNNFPDNAKLLFNIGNCHFKLNNLGKSIYYYKKSLMISPSSSDTKKNLNYAKTKSIDKTKTNTDSFLTNLLVAYKQTPMSSVLFIYSGMLLITSLLCLVYIKNKRGELFKNIFFLNIIIFIISTLSTVAKIHYSYNQSAGIVIAKKVDVKAGPAETLSTLFYIHEGTEINIIKKTKTWAKIELENGMIGWVDDKTFWEL